MRKCGQEPLLTSVLHRRVVSKCQDHDVPPKAASSTMPSTGLMRDWLSSRLMTTLRRSSGTCSRPSPASTCDCRPLPHAQPLPSAVVAPRARRSLHLHALADDNPHPALACPSQDGRHRPSVSRPVQVVHGPVGRAFSHSVPLRPTEHAAGELGRPRGAVEVGEPVGSSDQGRGGATDLDALADRTSARLDGAGQPAVPPDRGGGDSSQRAATSTVRFRVVACRASGQARSGVIAPAQRPTTKTTEQGLLPLFCPTDHFSHPKTFSPSDSKRTARLCPRMIGSSLESVFEQEGRAFAEAVA